MTFNRAGNQGRAGIRGRPASAGVLADRMAAALVHHEPGWRLPRLTALAKRYNVSAAEVDTAIGELALRHLVRRLPDGQVYRASPAEYRVPIEGVSGLASHVDPMGGQLACKSQHSMLRRPPEDIARSLGLAAGERVLIVRCQWTVGGEPGALSASYLPERFATPASASPDDTGDGGPPPTASRVISAAVGTPPERRRPVSGGIPASEDGHRLAGDGATPPGPLFFPRGLPADTPALPRALHIELGLPPPSAARSLHLAVGEPAVSVTVSFAGDGAGSPVALTLAMLRLELFRIVLEIPPPSAPAGGLPSSSTAWTHAAQGWEP